MTELTDFLLARIGEDENLARSAGHGCRYMHEHNGGWVEVALPDEHNARPAYEMRFIRAINPDRVLAECAAKLRVVEEWEGQQGVAFADAFAGQSYGHRQYIEGLEFAMRLLALPYAAHPDYREEWAL